MTKRVAGYGRVSTLEQAEHGTSATDQRQRIEGECKKNGWELYKFYSDFGISGARMENRPGIQSLIEDAKSGKFDTILFTKLDRIGRNQKELLIFWDLITEELRLDLVCLDDPSVNTTGRMGKAIRGLLSTFADFEKDLIKERMLGGRKRKWQAGKAFVGRIPFGYRWDKTSQRVEINPEQANIYQKIVSMYIDEHFDMLTIADKLTEHKIPTPRGDSKRWTPRTVSMILGNPAYTGEAIYNKRTYEQKGSKFVVSEKEKPATEHVKVKLPPLIDISRFEQIEVRRELQRKKAKKHHYEAPEAFLAYNVLYCGECGGKITKRMKREKSGRLRTYYSCYWKSTNQRKLDHNNRKRCIVGCTDTERIDNIIFGKMCEVLANPSKFAEQWLRDLDLESLLNRIEQLKKEESQAEKRLQRAYDLIVNTDDDILVTKFKQRLSEDRAEHQRIQSELKKAIEESNFCQNKIDRFREFEQALASSDRREKMKATFDVMGGIQTFLQNLPFKEKRRVLEAVIAPENGGKALLRYPTALEMYDDEALATMPKEERVKPLTDREPIVEMSFEIDLDRIENLVNGLKSQGKNDDFISYNDCHPLRRRHRYRRKRGSARTNPGIRPAAAGGSRSGVRRHGNHPEINSQP